MNNVTVLENNFIETHEDVINLIHAYSKDSVIILKHQWQVLAESEPQKTKTIFDISSNESQTQLILSVLTNTDMYEKIKPHFGESLSDDDFQTMLIDKLVQINKNHNNNYYLFLNVKLRSTISIKNLNKLIKNNYIDISDIESIPCVYTNLEFIKNNYELMDIESLMIQLESKDNEISKFLEEVTSVVKELE